MKRVLFIVIVLILAVGCSKDEELTVPPAPPFPPSSETPDWVLDFEDNFDGNALNTEEWSAYNGTGHNSNGLRHSGAFGVKDGSLVVTARMCEVNEAKTQALVDGNWINIASGSKLSADGNYILVSGGMRHRREYKPGTKFEFRICTESDASNATSAVILTWPKDGSDRNTRCEESDIYETGASGASTRSRISSFFHYGPNPNTNGGIVTQVQKNYNVDATEWHTMTFEWYADKVYVFLDGVKQWTIMDKDIVPIYDHHLCIQLDAFGASLKEPNSTVRMYVDWVKIYVPSRQ